MSNTESPGIAHTTNGSTKTPSALAKLLEESKGKKVNETDRKAITNAFVKVMAERQKLQEQLSALDKKADETYANMVRCYGSKHVTVSGVRYVPTSREERVYYKKMNDTQDTVALD